MRKKRCNPYSGGKIPPCSEYLGNIEPIIKHGSRIYRNENRLYYFISTHPNTNTDREGSLIPITSSPITNKPFNTTNIQVSISTYIIGFFIHKIQVGEIEYSENMLIHSNKNINNMIQELMKKSPEVNMDFITKLSYTISNGNSILPLFTHAINITHLNYYILLLLNRFEGNPGLLFGNNSYTTEDQINLTLADINIWFN